MGTVMNPYISFRSGAEEALEYYRLVFGGQLEIKRFSEIDMGQGPDEGNKVLHGALTTESGLTLMCADTPDSMELDAGGNISISLSGEDLAELRGYWDGLSDGGTITAPFATAPWGDSFGMCIDRHGVNWMVNVSAA